MLDLLDLLDLLAAVRFPYTLSTRLPCRNRVLRLFFAYRRNGSKRIANLLR